MTTESILKAIEETPAHPLNYFFTKYYIQQDLLKLGFEEPLASKLADRYGICLRYSSTEPLEEHSEIYTKKGE
jgi:hypothetical protein